MASQGVHAGGAESRRKLLIGTLCVAPLVLLMAARASDLLARRQRLLDAGDRRAANLAVVLTGYLAQTLSSADAALRQLAIHSTRVGGADAAASEWFDLLSTARAGLAGVGSISLVDSAGIIRQSTQPPIVGQSRRDTYVFRRLSSDSADVLVADPPFRTTYTVGRPMLLPVARRLRTASGGFDGMVVATLLPDSLRQIFRAVDVGTAGQVVVMHFEGIVLLREPSTVNPIGENVGGTSLFREARTRATGFHRGLSIEGGPVFRSAFRAGPLLPFIVAVSLSEEELLQAWHADVRLSAAVFGGLVIVTALFLLMLFRQMDVGVVAQRSVVASEERFRLLATATNDAVWDWDLTSNRLWWNDGFAALVGERRNELLPTIDSWAEHVHPDDRRRVRHDFDQALHRGDSDWQAEYRFLRAGGGHAFVLDRAHIIRDSEGNAIRVIGGIVDRTARRVAEERLREQAALLDNATDAILLCELDHRIRYWNRGAERLYGWTAEEAMGKSTIELLYRDPHEFLEAFRKVMRTGSWSGELEQVTKAGDRVTVEARFTQLKTPEGAPHAILSINTDITQRLKLEQQFLRAQRMESIGTLAGGIAHDLNNMLAPIVLSIEMLRENETDPEKLDLLRTIQDSARRGTDMVSQVLSFARGMDGKRLAIDARDLVRAVAKIANETFLKSIEVSTVVPDEIGTVSGDATQLHQVLLNLCVNARDAMPRGGRLTLSAMNVTIDEHFSHLTPGTQPGPYVLIQVEDTGVGMSGEVLDRIFDPFFTTKEPGKGTGLGLSTSLAIVRSHGGFLRAYSEPGEGATFRMYLPAIAQPLSDGPADTAGLLPRGNGEMVLVVDDEASIREVVRQTLQTFGYKVLLAADGAEASSLYAERRAEIAVVLTDMMMPVMDGATTIQVLRRIDRSVRIIAASGLSGPGSPARHAVSGVKHFLAKPYSAQSLLTVIREALEDEAPARVIRTDD